MQIVFRQLFSIPEAMHLAANIIRFIFLRDPTTILGYTGKLASTHLRMLEIVSYEIDMIVGWLENKNV